MTKTRETLADVPLTLTEEEKLTLKALAEHESAINSTLAVVLQGHSASMEKLEPLKREFWKRVAARLGSTVPVAIFGNYETGEIWLGKEAVDKMSLEERMSMIGMK